MIIVTKDSVVQMLSLYKQKEIGNIVISVWASQVLFSDYFECHNDQKAAITTVLIALKKINREEARMPDELIDQYIEALDQRC